MTGAGSSKGILPYQQIADCITRGIIRADPPVEDRIVIRLDQTSLR